MNRVILLLNVIVLATNFLLSLSATDSQIGMLESAAGLSYGSMLRVRRDFAVRDPAPAYLRVVQTLDSIATPQQLETITAAKLRAILAAVEEYYRIVGQEIVAVLPGDGDAASLRRAHAAIGSKAREGVERTLQAAFGNTELVPRLATEVLKNCR